MKIKKNAKMKTARQLIEYKKNEEKNLTKFNKNLKKMLTCKPK